jgi:cell division protein FtsW (lipid II flippase)
MVLVIVAILAFVILAIFEWDTLTAIAPRLVMPIVVVIVAVLIMFAGVSPNNKKESS